MERIYLLLLLFLPRIRSYDVRSVTTSWGMVRGEVVSPEGDDLPPVAQYLGIPYGVAPTGQYRFNMAISAAKWTHMPKDARKVSPVCIQTDMPELSETKAFKHTSAQRFDFNHRLLPHLKKQSEDCLYMNIYVPERLEISRDNYLPVMVIVHGEEYGWGTGNAFNGTTLAAYGHIIVVTLNYRLGVFGFLGRCESSSCSGNSGISDLVSALTMLNVILPSFGGDSKSVTLAGWGSGASLVSLLMASPLTQPGRRLFRRAILLDGSALSPWAISQNPQQYFMQLAEELACAPKNRTSSFNDNVDTIVRCMQVHSSENITKAVLKIDVPTFLSGFAPIVDGQLIPNKPQVSFSTQYGSLFREIDLLVGISSNPSHHMISNEDLKVGISKEKRMRIFRSLVRNLYDFHREEILASIINEYTDWENPRDHPKSIRNGVLNALSDVLYTAPLIETLRSHSADEVRKEANTFMFAFAHETRSWSQEQPNSGIRGSLSGDIVPYIFGYPLAQGDSEERLYSGFNTDDKGISKVMMHYVSNFVKSGDPSKPNPMSKNFPMGDVFHSTAWPQFDQPNREAYLEITDRPRVKNYYRNAQVGFWNNFIPQLHKNGKETEPVGEEHHLLSDHFRKDSYFGKTRHFSSYANLPFPPPPMPPSPPPELTTKPKPSESPTTLQTTTESEKAAAGSFTGKALGGVIFIGCGFLIMNVCLLIAVRRETIMLRAIILSLATVFVLCTESDYTVETYPNPKRGGYKECGLRSSGLVCDPYETLSESERYRINNQLINFVTKTEEGGNTFCSKKGTDAMFVIMNKASQEFADNLRKHWSTIDTQCGRFGLLVLSLDDRQIFGSFDERSPINMAQLQAIIATEENHIKTGAYTTAVTNILKEVAASMTPQKGVTTTTPASSTKYSPAQLSVCSFLAALLYFF